MNMIPCVSVRMQANGMRGERGRAADDNRKKDTGMTRDVGMTAYPEKVQGVILYLAEVRSSLT